jgi:hypothetical protein
MGCMHSSSAASSPSSAYPGNRRVAKPPHQPSADEYRRIDDTISIANAHFVTCPGGNALRLLDRPNRSSGGGGGCAKYISGESGMVVRYLVISTLFELCLYDVCLCVCIYIYIYFSLPPFLTTYAGKTIIHAQSHCHRACTAAT